jgi:chromate transporter
MEIVRDGAGELAEPPRGGVFDVFLAALGLGLTSFGGPVAHLGYFREEYVVRRSWLDDARYSDLVALCQFLPGPASSQVGIAIGTLRAGLPGGLAAWLGFTLPSALALIAFAYGVGQVDVSQAAWLHGLKVAAVAVVAYAVWGMARTLAPDRERITIAVLAATLVLLWQSPLSQVLVIALGGAIGRLLLVAPPEAATSAGRIPVSRTMALAALGLFAGLLVILPLLRELLPSSQPLALFDSFYRAGSLVFGGGHVVLPLLYTEVVTPGWVTNEEFVAGYGAAQAVPGPLFTFAGYLGAVMQPEPNGWQGASLALVAVFLPSFLLVFGALPFWDFLRTQPAFRRALLGINAAVVGLLLAALYDPVWTSAIERPEDFALALIALVALGYWRAPPWLVVAGCAAGGIVIGS